MNSKGMSPHPGRIAWKHSIQTRMTAVILAMMAMLLTVNVFIFRHVATMVRRIDSVFASNVSITELSDQLSTVEGLVYDYLNTKSSVALENYYRSCEDYRTLVDQLNRRNSGNPVLMLEKNIRGMSLTYLQKAEETVQAKRGRNVERYKNAYGECEQLCRYIKSYIYQLNGLQFEKNSGNYQFLLKVMRGMELLSLLVIIVIMLFSVVAIVMMIRSMIQPLRTLSGAAHQVEQGDLNVEVPVVDSQDEIGVVTQTFNQMLGSIRAYIERVRESMQDQAKMKERELSMEANLKEAQLKFLQAQINPHFLFNSLNAGAQLAMMEDAESTGVFLERMADFFRYNVKKTDGYSTLGEEIELVDNYIYILNVRFAGDIHFTKETEDGLSKVVVPGMILQPLVENAVTHGIRDMLGLGQIRMSITREENGIQVTVADNGAGMTREQIQEILEGSGTAAKEGVSTGIGLENVKNRLRLFYDQEGLMSIYSPGKGMGTEVTLLLPVLTKAERLTRQTEEETAEKERTKHVSDIDRG